jgi:hypothetical protein
MRKLFLLLIPIAFLLIYFGCQQIPTEPEDTGSLLLNGNVTTIDLIAGQNIEVGYIDVWNDETNLYVKYVIDEPGWCLEETHVAVAYSPEEIPQTKKGNPIPGQFPHKHEDIGCEPEDLYTIPLVLINPSWDCNDDLYIATHAVVQNQNIECIDFEIYSEKEAVNTVSTSAGNIQFYMTKSQPLFGLNIGDEGTFEPPNDPADLYPIVATPETSPPEENIVAFTVGTGLVDDKVFDDNGTGAGGNNLTDPQDLSQIPLLQHAYSKYLAIVVDVSDIDALQKLNLVSIDMDHNEEWHFQYFNDDNILIYEAILNQGNVGLGDGKAFPVDYSNPEISKVAIWGGNNLNIAERIGYAIDNICITTIEEETAWGAGFDFPGNNWALYFEYTIECNGGGSGCPEETAWGGDSLGGGSAWWYYFDTQGPLTQKIYAGNEETDGTVTYDPENDKLIIDLDIWELQSVSEPVKVEGYNIIPSTRPAAGGFTYKTFTYNGTLIEVQVGEFPYYAIHLDVQYCE